MEENRGTRVFPFYLKVHPENEAFLKWIGQWLRDKRDDKPVDKVAKAAQTSTSQVEKLEQGCFDISLGQVRSILRRGYGAILEDILSKCYDHFRDSLDPKHNRRFMRDYHYSFCFGREDVGSDRTPVLAGGDGQRFLWAVPFRKLKKQPLYTELLELAPARKRKSSGGTPENAHEGAEVIYVIHGAIRVHIDGGSEGPYDRLLRHENCIHFNSSNSHRITNDGNTTSALLLIVRLPENPA